MEIDGHVRSLDEKCRGSEAEIGGSIDFAATDLAKHGIDRTRSSLAAELDKSIEGFEPNFDCQGFVAAYLVTEEAN